MKYSKARQGRIFIVKFEHKDDLLTELKKLAEKEKINFATIIFLGALAKGKIIAGPKKLEVPATGDCLEFNDGREVLGLGTIVRDKNGTHAHIHAAYGKKKNTLTGCLRDDGRVFITVEAVITEFKGVKVSRAKDKKTGHRLLKFG